MAVKQYHQGTDTGETLESMSDREGPSLAGVRDQTGQQRGKRLAQSKEQITKGLNSPAENWAVTSCIQLEYNSKQSFLRMKDNMIFLTSSFFQDVV